MSKKKLDASGVSTQFIESMINSDRHHIGNIRGNAFFPALNAPDDPHRQDASHHLVIFERKRVFVPKNQVEEVQKYLEKNYERPGLDLLTADSEYLEKLGWGRLGIPHETLSNRTTLELLDALDWRLLDLRDIPETTTKEQGVVWNLVQKFRNYKEPSVQPVAAIPLSPFDNCVPYGRPHPTAAGGISRQGGKDATVLILDTGFRPHAFLTPAIVGVVDAAQDDDNAYVGGTSTLRQGAGHGTFIAGIVHKWAADAAILVADVTDGVPNPNGYVVDEVQLFDSLCAGLSKTTTANLIVNLSIGAFFVPFDSVKNPFAKLVAATKDPTQATQIDLTNVPTGDHILYVAAGGNYAGSTAENLFPACLPDVLAIGALDPSGNRIAKFSASQALDAVAIGEDVIGPYLTGTVPGNAQVNGQVEFLAVNPWAKWSGTSFAVPRVCAAIARNVTPTVSAQSAWNVIKTVPQTVNGYPVIS